MDAAQGTGDTSRAPDRIRIDRQALTVLLRALAAAFPEEGCALLLGWTAPGLWRVDRIWPCLNVWSPRRERERRFAIDPREQLLAQKWARPQGRLVLGAAHSHPRSAAVPSPTDLALTLGPTLMLILGRTEPSEPVGPPRSVNGAQGPLGRSDDLACWWVPEPGMPQPRRLPWRMED